MIHSFQIGKAGITTENIFDKYKVYIVAEKINVDDLTTVGIVINGLMD